MAESKKPTRKPSPKKKPAPKSAKTPKPEEAPVQKQILELKTEQVPVLRTQCNNQFWSIILFALGVLTLLLIVIHGTNAWKAIHDLLFGLFGIAAVLVPIILIYTAILIGMEKNEQAAGKAFWGFGLTMLASAIVQIFFYGDFQAGGFVESVKTLYAAGVQKQGGGLFSALIAVPLLKLFDETGARIIVLLLLFVMVMLLTNTGLIDLFKFLGKPFRAAKTAVHTNYHEDEDSWDLYDDDPKDQEALRLGNATPSRRATHASHRDFSFDVPILEEPKKAPSPTASGAPEPISPEWQQAADAVPLDDLIAAATAASAPDTEPAGKKQTKKQETAAVTAEIEAEVLTQEAQQQPEHEYRLPPIDFLNPGISRAKDPKAAMELRQNADTLVDTLNSFGVQVRITGINRGPSVTRYEVQPSAGVKIAKITNLADDIALNLSAAGVRIEAPIPGKPAVGIEVPNSNKDTVSLREILESPAFLQAKSKLTFAIGKDIDGNIILGDIAKMPHMIIAGATGSGKSVCTNSIIMSILYHAKPSEVKLVLIDPKIVEFKLYDGIPHLLIPVVTDPRKAAGALNWATQEMDRRYALCASCNVRDINDFNQLAAKREDLTPLPQIVIVIDEFAELMMTSSKEVEDAVCRIAQKARAAGMHLIIATQRPTADVITGLIKSNVPSRIALFVKVQMDSRNILDVGGAEKLLGNGDMLYSPNGLPKPIRIQGCFCTSEEIERVVDYVKSEAKAEYSEDIIEAVEQSMPVQKSDRDDDPGDRPAGDDELIERAIEVVAELGQASTSSLQRKLKLGYARAARIMDELEEMGVIGPHEGAKPRKVLITTQQVMERRARKNAQE